MAYLSSLVVFCLYSFASDVVELEPVSEGGCSSLNGQGAGPCNALWYCAYTTDSTCINDPCFRIQDTDATCEDGQSSENVSCHYYAGASGNTNLALHDCSATTTNGGYCASAGRTGNRLINYCGYAAKRDGGTCPQSICKKDPAQDNNCVPANGLRCQLLSEGDCKLAPKCMWNSSNQCSPDPCFGGTGTGGSTNENQVCAGASGWIPTTAYNPNDATTIASLVAGDCSKEYKPYKTGGGLTTYCIHKNHKDDPNLCYFLGYYGNDTTSPDDYFTATGSAPTCTYVGTYPTYNEFGGCVLNPQCAAQVDGCDGVQECATKYNPTGAFAGQYCGDATHGAAVSLRIPSFVALLVFGIFAFFS